MEEEEEEEEEFVQSELSSSDFVQSELRGGLRARPRYPGVEDEFRRATFLRETRPDLSMLLCCLSIAVSASVRKGLGFRV